MSLRRMHCIALLLATAVSLTGCDSALGGQAIPGETDVRTLNTGNYPTRPLDFRYQYFNHMSHGKNLAIMRLADHTAVGHDIDPKLTYTSGSIPILNSDDATRALAKVAGPVVDRDQMMFGIGFGSADAKEESKQSMSATILIMQFPSETLADKAAADIEAADYSVSPVQNARVSIPKYPTAHAHWRPGVPTIGATISQGQYVVNLYLGREAPDINALTAMAGRALDVQLPLLKSLPPLTGEEVVGLPYDPDGMLRRTLNPQALGIPDYVSEATGELSGFLRRVGEPETWQRVLGAAGVDRYALSGEPTDRVFLFRARDDDAAKTLPPELLKTSYSGAAAPPPGVPAAACGERKTEDDSQPGRFRCIVVYRRYVGLVQSDQLLDAQQRAAAQYATLANNE